MPFPTEFPADAAKAIGNAILSRTFDKTLVEPAYDVVGYGLYLAVGASGLPPRPPVPLSTASVEPADADEVARQLIVAAEDAGDDDGLRALPIPWGQVISILLSLIQGVLVSEATK
jgi:hypothetical protein